MEGTILVWVVVVGIVVAGLAWFGPRLSQWRSHGDVDVDEDEEEDEQ